MNTSVTSPAKLSLPNVTLLFVETRAHKITERVIRDCMSKVDFGDVLVYTDDRDKIGIDNIRYTGVHDFANKRDAGKFYYQFAMREVHTEFALMMEWDAGISDITKWRPDFMAYDYIGAPWKVRRIEENRLDVGNGGFALMSKRLGHFLATYPDQYPVDTDWNLCRNQRYPLEQKGFKWPSRELAAKFSWELTPLPDDGVFGFHATFTWPWMLSREEVIARAKLMTETPYLLSKMPDLMRKAPWLEQELGPELFAKYRRQHPGAAPFRIAPEQRATANRILTQRRALYQSQINRSGLKA